MRIVVFDNVTENGVAYWRTEAELDNWSSAMLWFNHRFDHIYVQYVSENNVVLIYRAN